MTRFDDVLTLFPPDVQAMVRKVWEALGPHEKASFRSLLVGFPADAKLLNMDHRGRIRGRLFPQPSVPR